MGLLGPLLYLLSGTLLNTVSQLITNTDFSAPDAHIIPFVKFTATLVGSGLRRPKGGSPATREQRVLMGLIGLLDAAAYTVFCLGFYSCGATLANLVLSGVGQLLTAALTRVVLRRRLTRGQLAGILFVSMGLIVRAAPASYFGAGDGREKSKQWMSVQPEQLIGVGLVALAALFYSLLGVAYEKLLKGTQKPPPNAEIMWQISMLGFLASSAYQALYTLPNWDRLVRQRMAANGTNPVYVGGLLLLFGTQFNLHVEAQAAVFKSDGAIGVGLVNAVRGAVITIVVALLFCSSAKPHLCLTRQTIISAAITTAGGAVYVLSGGQYKKGAGPAAAASDKRRAEASSSSSAAAPAAAEKKDQ